MDGLILLKTFTYPHEALVIKSKLDAEQVPYFIKDENTVLANPLYSQAIGGAKLYIRKKDLELVRELFSDYAKGETKKACPACDSTELITKNKFNFIGIIFSILAFFPFVKKIRKKYICKECDHTF